MVKYQCNPKINYKIVSYLQKVDGEVYWELSDTTHLTKPRFVNRKFNDDNLTTNQNGEMKSLAHSNVT